MKDLFETIIPIGILIASLILVVCFALLMALGPFAIIAYAAVYIARSLHGTP